MKNIPDKCLKCGAPIKWDKTSNHIDCEYCGYTNLINNANSSKIKKFNKLSENIFRKFGTFSKNKFSKAKDSLNKNKKFIFPIPISILSIFLYIEFFTFSPEKFCKKGYQGLTTYKNNSIHPGLVGCWYKRTTFEDSEKVIHQYIVINNYKEFPIITYTYNTKEDRIGYSKISNISYEWDEIKFDMEWDYGAKSRQSRSIKYQREKKNLLNVFWKFKKGNFEGNFTMKRVSPKS